MNIRFSTLVALSTLVAVVLPASLVSAQEAPTRRQRIDHDLKYLASDELEGREPGSKGIEMAADYIIDEFKEAGVLSGTKDGTYRQLFEIKMGTDLDKENSTLVLRGPNESTIELKIGVDAQPLMVGGNGEASAELVFVGYGISDDENMFDEFKDVDVEGKIIVVMRMEPQQKDPKSVFKGTEVSSHATITQKIRVAKLNKAAGIIMVNDQHTAPSADKDDLSLPSQFGSAGRRIPFFHVKRETIDKVLSESPLVNATGDKITKLSHVEALLDDTLDPVSQEIKGWKAEIKSSFKDRTVSTSNIIGVVEGEGPNADETILVGGHYDHLGFGGYGSNAPGRREIHNGADDNATGTAGIVELARRFAQNPKKPGRRIVFVAFSGEERGLLGSAFYVEEPLFPLEKTVAMINYDMIGRLRNDKLTIYGTGTAELFDKVCEAANDKDNALDLNKISSPFAGSDHMAFVRKNIPVMFIHTGLTDIYHTPEDDYETLNVDGAVRVINFTERMVGELANSSEKPAYVEVARQRRARRPSFLGVEFDYESNEKGAVINEVVEDGPAATAGLKKSDIVVDINGKTFKDRADLIKFLTENRPGSEVDVKIIRDGEEQTLKVKLSRTPRRQRRSSGSGG